MYSCGFPNTIQHVQRDLQLNDARAVTCVMEKVEKDEGDGARQGNWMFYQLTKDGLDFWSNSDPDDENLESDNNENHLPHSTGHDSVSIARANRFAGVGTLPLY